jgi:hypothetical protein
MSDRKNYNSIVFLTTLSVYLGLVLAGGATPSVLAQAAMTRDFDIKNEIVFEDDLDKKPDGEESLDVYGSLYQRLFELAGDFAKKNRSALRGNKYEFDCSVVFHAKSSNTVTCRGGSGLFWGGFIPSFKSIGQAFPHTADEKNAQVGVNLILSDTEFFPKSSFRHDSDWHSARASNFYDNVLSRARLRESNAPRKTLYENTKISFENNQFFIVTRLPRGSIDELLAENNAKL